MSINLTPTLSLVELIVGLSCIYGLVMATWLAIDYSLDVILDAEDPEVRVAAVVGLRNAIALALVNLLFMAYVLLAAVTPPPVRLANVAAYQVSQVLFELMVVILAGTATLNLHDRRGLRRRR